ncbi:UNVERIFIED_CONTAM: hypothetical protein K2H54_037116 [Gekko kuhli]
MQKMASSLKEISPELRDGITSFLGTQEVFLLPAQFHVKSKVEDIVLVLLPWRALVLPAKLPVKVQASFSYLSVQLIKMGDAGQLCEIDKYNAPHIYKQCLRLKNKLAYGYPLGNGPCFLVVIETDSTYEFDFLSLDNLEHVVIHMVEFLKKMFPDSSLW